MLPVERRMASLLCAVLGPTNTGKTHRAVERMLEHNTGMIGLPLRLLAREVYDKISTRVGERRVALVTGEEKRVPPNPSYWVCTVEAMPMHLDVDFLAVDEIQLVEHPERGHVFTDRLLNAGGRLETWFLGADTMDRIIAELLPTIEIRRHPRLSRLSHAGTLSLATLPQRSAVIAFSAPQVYEIADRIRNKRGGAAVVLGALSPRTRNAQIALYQSGEVKYLVATDAIGMGLNMDVDLIAFSSLRKFDGKQARSLDPSELAQIAGRAGRYQNDGRFGTLSPAPVLSDENVFAIENHNFPLVRKALYRNSDLNMHSIDSLLESLRVRPKRHCLRMADDADDLKSLVALSSSGEIRARARTQDAVGLLWDICQIPDFRQLLLDVHIHLLEELFHQLAGPKAILSSDWVNERVEAIELVDGDIDTLMNRIAFIRTWTYIANRASWLADAPHWQERTRAIEDRLSDALHQRLVQRFVSKSSDNKGVFRRRISRAAKPSEPQEPVNQDSPFRVLLNLKLPNHKEVRETELPLDHWIQQICEAPHERFRVDNKGAIWDDGECIAKLTRGADLLRPEVALLLDDDLGGGAKLRVTRRLIAYARDLVSGLFSPMRNELSAQLSGYARGLVYQVEASLGTILAESAYDQIRHLSEADRMLLPQLDIIVGEKVVYLKSSLKPSSVTLRSAFCHAFFGAPIPSVFPSAVQMASDNYSSQLLCALGFPKVGKLAVRADVLERVWQRLSCPESERKEAIRDGSRWLGCKSRQTIELMQMLGLESKTKTSLAERS